MNQSNDGVGPLRVKPQRFVLAFAAARALWDDPDPVRLLGVTRITADGPDLAIVSPGN
jgi:hypothetical protein